MWMALVLACTSESAFSCQVMANSKELFRTEKECKADSYNMSSYLMSKGSYALPICIEVGVST
jgi:hypothetical protein